MTCTIAGADICFTANRVREDVFYWLEHLDVLADSHVLD